MIYNLNRHILFCVEHFPNGYLNVLMFKQVDYNKKICSDKPFVMTHSSVQQRVSGWSNCLLVHVIFLLQRLYMNISFMTVVKC